MADIIVAGNTSGAITISAPLVAGSGTLTLPVATDTLAGIAATQTLTNKTLVAPALGTPASGVLTNCTGVPASALPAGSVLQVVQGSIDTQASTSSSAYSDTGLTASITPKFATSKILVLISHPENAKSNGNASNAISFNLCRNGTQIVKFSANTGGTSTAASAFFGQSFNYLDSPATTSSTTYKTQFNSTQNVGTTYVQYSGTSNNLSTITLMEIAV